MALFDIGHNLKEYCETCEKKKAEIAELEIRYQKLKKTYARLNTKLITAQCEMQRLKEQTKQINEILG